MPRILSIVMLLTATTPVLGQESSVLKKYPLRCKVECVPKEIYFGDLVFATITFTNEGDRTIIVPKSLYYGGIRDYDGCAISLTQDDSENNSENDSEDDSDVFDWRSSKVITERMITSHGDGPWNTFGHSLKPGKSHVVGFRPLWVPRPEFIEGSKARKFKQAVDSKPQSFQWKIRLSFGYSDMHGPLGDPPYKRGGHPNYMPFEGISPDKLSAYLGDSYPHFSVSGGDLKIRPRPDEELALLNEWFLELAETRHATNWNVNGVFAHPLYSARAPLLLPELYCRYEVDWSDEESMRRASQRYVKLKEHWEAFDALIEKMKTRIPEVEKRIARTKELEKQLLERAERPDSTISSTMKEFIVFRGHLVEIRYARDKDAESKAFDVMLDWIETTRYDDLWKKYLDKIVLNKRSHPDVLSPESFDEYRARFLDEKGG